MSGLPNFVPILSRRTIPIEPALVEMADLNRIEAVDIFAEPFPADRTAQDIEGMRRESENGVSASHAQLANIVKGPESCSLLRQDIQEDDVRSTEAHFRRRNQEDAHGSGILKDPLSVEKRNCAA